MREEERSIGGSPKVKEMARRKQVVMLAMTLSSPISIPPYFNMFVLKMWVIGNWRSSKKVR